MRLGLVVENDAAFVFEEVEAMRRAGNRVAVASVFRPEPAKRWHRHYGGPVLYPDPGVRGWTRAALPGGLRQPARLAELLKIARQEGAPPRLAVLGAVLAERARAEGWQHVHGSFAAFPAWVAWACSRLTGLPFSFTGHAYDVQRPFPWLARVVGEAAFVRAISQETADRLLAVAPDAADRVRVGTLGVDVTRFSPCGLPPADPPEILTVANLVPKKGHAVLLDAAARLKCGGHSFTLRLLGDGPLRAELEERAHSLGLAEVVRFEGAADRAAVHRALRRATLFALPCVSLPGPDHDGIPVALLEAMACGLPVVSCAVGGIPEAIACGRNGRLAAPGDAGGLARVLAELLAEGAERARLGAGARETVVSCFDLEQSAARLVSWMASSARSPRTPSLAVAGART